ncbi:MAG: hypothetical protein PVJ04_10675 [Gemmatimonadota bacterium]|jgi:hypothetical protein
MSAPSHADPILTLEPFLDAVRDGLDGEGWELSGLQKTTSYEFEGRWAGESSRSAYLFFHREDLPDWASIDAFLDETSRGLRGNLALVLDGPVLARIRDPGRAMEGLTVLARDALPRGYQAPLTLRYRLPDLGENAAGADTEIRIKLVLPKEAMRSGFSAVSALAATAARAFQEIMRSPGLQPYWPEEDGSGSLGV